MPARIWKLAREEAPYAISLDLQDRGNRRGMKAGWLVATEGSSTSFFIVAMCSGVGGVSPAKHPRRACAQGRRQDDRRWDVELTDTPNSHPRTDPIVRSLSSTNVCSSAEDHFDKVEGQPQACNANRNVSCQL